MKAPSLAFFAVPAVLCLVGFLSFTSQYLFHRIDPGPLKRGESFTFNVLITSLLVCYARAIGVDPGRIPSDWAADCVAGVTAGKRHHTSEVRLRWCRKCEAHKTPRAHHCKICKRCIPKMDHHCPWTYNCVSHLTFPHFIRFLFYCVAAMAYLEYLLYIRIAIIWQNRGLAMSLGPSIPELIHLFFLVLANSLTLFALSILLVRSAWSLAVNTYTIEGWEIERHEALVRRARYTGGYLDGPDGIRIKIEHQEFPYDIGIWRNLKHGMGTANFFAWFWPFSRTPTLESGLTFETNEFDQPTQTWPPPDPDRIPRQARRIDEGTAFIFNDQEPEEQLKSFQQRQREDMKRWEPGYARIRRRRPFAERYDEDANTISSDEEDVFSDEGEEGWRNSEGERLDDFGVDEEVEFYDEDEIPLSELIRRKVLPE